MCLLAILYASFSELPAPYIAHLLIGPFILSILILVMI